MADQTTDGQELRLLARSSSETQLHPTHGATKDVGGEDSDPTSKVRRGGHARALRWGMKLESWETAESLHCHVHSTLSESVFPQSKRLVFLHCA